jgi:hypothetical protein
MPSKKDKEFTPEELAARVKRSMIASAPDVDLYQFIDLDELEQKMIAEIKKIRLLTEK